MADEGLDERADDRAEDRAEQQPVLDRGPNAPDDPCTRSGSAIAYLTCTLAASEFADFAQHLEDGCGSCASELEDARVTLAALDAEYHWEQESAPEPPAAVLERVRAGLRGLEDAPADRRQPSRIQTWKSWQAGAPAAGALDTLRSDEGLWESIGIPGISVKRLSVDPRRRSVTMLVRMEPGSAYPAHRHAAPEECYVIEGDLRIGREIVMHGGDFQRAAAGSLHDVQSTRGGCTLLITSSQDDELA